MSVFKSEIRVSGSSVYLDVSTNPSARMDIGDGFRGMTMDAAYRLKLSLDEALGKAEIIAKALGQ